MKQIW